MEIRILLPNLTVLGKVRDVGEIVDDANADECRNLVADGRAEYIAPLESDSPAVPTVDPVTEPTPA